MDKELVLAYRIIDQEQKIYFEYSFKGLKLLRELYPEYEYKVVSVKEERIKKEIKND